MRDYKVYVRLKREPIYQPCDSTQPPLSGALDLTETNALLVPIPILGRLCYLIVPRPSGRVLG
jgi:hypothetical protein